LESERKAYYHQIAIDFVPYHLMLDSNTIWSSYPSEELHKPTRFITKCAIMEFDQADTAFWRILYKSIENWIPSLVALQQGPPISKPSGVRRNPKDGARMSIVSLVHFTSRVE
jgi:hypothetical protein